MSYVHIYPQLNQLQCVDSHCMWNMAFTPTCWQHPHCHCASSNWDLYTDVEGQCSTDEFNWNCQCSHILSNSVGIGVKSEDRNCRESDQINTMENDTMYSSLQANSLKNFHPILGCYSHNIHWSCHGNYNVKKGLECQDSWIPFCSKQSRGAL